MDDLRAKLDAIKNLNWNNASVSFFVVKRKLRQRSARYETLHVDIHESLAKKLRDIAVGKMNRSNTARPYDFNTTDLDDDLLSLPTEDTDMQGIIDTLQGEEDPPTVERYENLLESWMYIARFDVNGRPPLFSARSVSEIWKTKKIFQWINMTYQNNMLVSLDEQQIFRIDGRIDFFAYESVLFIADKKNFERALNFREGMEKNRDEIVKDFSKLGLFQDANTISTLVGNNIPRLRRLSQVKKAGYYQDTNFLEKLKEVNEEDGWGIQYSQDGKLVVTEENIETILRVLNNDRLTSKINDENFDVDVKHKFRDQ